MSRLKFALGAVAATLALVPAAAHAQGAGDDQYEDPFAGEQEQATPAPTPRATATTEPAPAAPAPAPAQPAATATPVPNTAPAPPTLPYTGVDAWPLALGGVLLLGAGLKLRAHVGVDREP